MERLVEIKEVFGEDVSEHYGRGLEALRTEKVDLATDALETALKGTEDASEEKKVRFFPCLACFVHSGGRFRFIRVFVSTFLLPGFERPKCKVELGEKS